MNEEELAVATMMDSIQRKYFPELEGKLGYRVEKNTAIDGVMGRALFGIMEIILYYSDDRILQEKYRMGLVPVISHEIAHFIDPVAPERILKERLPKEMFDLWMALVEAGHAQCSMEK